mmetsp:Transcript_12671/g.41287  ORF Transcript_12671/g.41287 Transcript_12671/m.41287 type:complete len:286 (-) Transcript_12671:288-1145(-)
MSSERRDDERPVLHPSAAMLTNAQDAWARLYPGQAIVQFDSEESFMSWANTEPELMGVLSDSTGADGAQPLHWYERREPTDTGQRNPACTLAVAHTFGNPAATTATATGGSATHADASSSAAAATRPAATVAAVGSGAPVRRRISGRLPVSRASHDSEDKREFESLSFGDRARAHAASATTVTDAGSCIDWATRLQVSDKSESETESESETRRGAGVGRSNTSSSSSSSSGKPPPSPSSGARFSRSLARENMRYVAEGSAAHPPPPLPARAAQKAPQSQGHTGGK